MEKQLGWAHKLSGPDLWRSPGQGSVSQVDGASYMAPACVLCGSVTLWGEGSEKGQWPLPAFCLGESYPPALDVRHFIFSLYATGAFQAATPVL